MDGMSNPLKLECFEETKDQPPHTHSPAPLHPEKIKTGKGYKLTTVTRGKENPPGSPDPQRPLEG